MDPVTQPRRCPVDTPRRFDRREPILHRTISSAPTVRCDDRLQAADATPVRHLWGFRMRRFYLYRWTVDEPGDKQLVFVGQGVMFVTGLIVFGWGSGTGPRIFESLEHMFGSLHTRCLQFLDGEPPSPLTYSEAVASR